jgi:hypothetical protein
MPITNALITVALALPFLIFMAVLAWGEKQTRHLNNPPNPAYAPRRFFGVSHVARATPSQELAVREIRRAA